MQRAWQLRHRIDGMLLESIESGATIAMDDRDWTAIRKAARAGVKPKRKRKKQ